MKSMGSEKLIFIFRSPFHGDDEVKSEDDAGEGRLLSQVPAVVLELPLCDSLIRHTAALTAVSRTESREVLCIWIAIE